MNKLRPPDAWNINIPVNLASFSISVFHVNIPDCEILGFHGGLYLLQSLLDVTSCWNTKSYWCFRGSTFLWNIGNFYHSMMVQFPQDSAVVLPLYLFFTNYILCIVKLKLVNDPPGCMESTWFHYHKEKLQFLYSMYFSV